MYMFIMFMVSIKYESLVLPMDIYRIWNLATGVTQDSTT